MGMSINHANIQNQKLKTDENELDKSRKINCGQNNTP